MAVLTQKQIERQDEVDNKIFTLLSELAPSHVGDWNIEHVGTVRDALRDVLVKRLKALPDQEFYPQVEPLTNYTVGFDTTVGVSVEAKSEKEAIRLANKQAQEWADKVPLVGINHVTILEPYVVVNDDTGKERVLGD